MVLLVEVRGQRSEVRVQKSEVRDQWSEIRNWGKRKWSNRSQ